MRGQAGGVEPAGSRWELDRTKRIRISVGQARNLNQLKLHPFYLSKYIRSLSIEPLRRKAYFLASTNTKLLIWPIQCKI
jgi:hypothetical protein